MVDQLLEIGTTDSGKSASSVGAKKPYRSPIITKLGSLREITTSVGSSGAADGGTGMSPRNTKRGGNFEAAS